MFKLPDLLFVTFAGLLVQLNPVYHNSPTTSAKWGVFFLCETFRHEKAEVGESRPTGVASNKLRRCLETRGVFVETKRSQILKWNCKMDKKHLYKDPRFSAGRKCPSKFPPKKQESQGSDRKNPPSPAGWDESNPTRKDRWRSSTQRFEVAKNATGLIGP